MINKTEEYLKDADGIKSSKRLIGVILVLSSVFMSVCLFVFCLINNDIELALGIIKTLALAGASLLGIGIFDKLLRK